MTSVVMTLKPKALGLYTDPRSAQWVLVQGTQLNEGHSGLSLCCLDHDPTGTGDFPRLLAWKQHQSQLYEEGSGFGLLPGGL